MAVVTQSCGDVLTKKKLDAHRGQCRGASFTCLDCMTHFQGAEYKAHTSCISEAQKYQGALYKEKPSKARKSVTIHESTALVPRNAYVEDALDLEDDKRGPQTDAPPPAPSPPSASVTQPVNVFDFLVADDTPNASRVSLGGSKEQMSMVQHAPSVFRAHGSDNGPNPSDDENNDDDDPQFHAKGYSYGAAPISTTQGRPASYQTPAPKVKTHRHTASQDSIYELEARSQKSTDKKRKRQLEDLDLTQARLSSQELDEVMLDAHESSSAPPFLHSGLTGGLNRLLSKSRFPPSPDYSGGDPEPSPHSPLKRPKSLLAEKDKRRGRTITTMHSTSGALIKVRKVRRTSDESRPRKHHRSHRHGESPDRTAPHKHHDRDRDRDHDAPGTKRKVKAIEYHPSATHSHSSHDDSPNQLVVYRSRAELFLSFVTKGPDSENGCSLNKALKRYHRERGEQGLGMGKAEEEKELWKSLRLRRNERGEVVLIF
ncbi:hypothetical protein MMC19_002706 [Ptychographa xylographoides]|nr:hypothetical protein [Ptychographa xylographoides]